MDYSLRTLSQNSDLKLLTLTSLIDNLNLIGFEVDDIFYEKKNENSLLNEINLLLKIPANREDLLNEISLEKEFSTIFLLKLFKIWENLKSNYSFILKQKYFQYQNYKTIKIYSSFSDFLIYSIEIENVTKQVSPIWIQKKLLSKGIKPQKNFSDFLSLVNVESGQIFNISTFSKNSEVQLILEKEEKNFINLTKNELNQTVLKETIFLKNGNEKIKPFLSFGETNNFLFPLNLNNEKLVLHAIFYNIVEDPLHLTNILEKNSLRNLRKINLQQYRSSFQRLLTLFELITNAKIKPIRHILTNKRIKIDSHRILKLKKLNLECFLNTSIIDLTIFQKLGLRIVCFTPDVLYIQVPQSRKDLLREIDLIEEYTRIFGYKNFVEIAPTKQIIYSKKNRKNIQVIKNFFLAHQFKEIVTSSLIQETIISKKNAITLLNPLSKEMSVLRKDLLLNMLNLFFAQLNSTSLGFNNRVFEIGRVFKNKNGQIFEQDKLAGIFILDNNIFKKENDDHWFYAKKFIETFLKTFGFDSLTIEPYADEQNIFHPKRSIKMIDKKEKKILGSFGELHPKLRKLNFIKYPIYLFEFNLIYFSSSKITNLINLFQEYSKYPSITKDLSFLIEKTHSFEKLKEIIEKNVDHLKKSTFFDLYVDRKLEKNINLIKIGIRFEFQSDLQTLTADTVESEMQKISSLLEEKFAAKFTN